MAVLLDAAGERAEPGADLLVATGIAAAVPTAVAGLNDWSDTRGSESRVGLVHATLNTAALGIYTASLIARRRGSRGVGKALSLTGFSILISSAYLGGHLSYSQGVNVNHTAWRQGPADWTAAMAEADLADGQPAKKAIADVTVLLYRSGESITAIDSVCSHMGGPLEEGTIADGCVTCPWHGSTFQLEDGGIVRGPASNPQPGYQVRVREGQIEVRRRQLQG